MAQSEVSEPAIQQQSMNTTTMCTITTAPNRPSNSIQKKPDSSPSNPFITMNTPQFKMQSIHYIPWYNSKRNSLIFATRSNDYYCKPGIYELDLESTKITFLTGYVHTSSGDSRHIYMPDDETVCIIDRFQFNEEEINITKFNLSTNIMTYEPIKIFDDQTTNLLRYIAGVFCIPSNDTLHGFCVIDDAQNSFRYHTKHFVFDTKQNSVVKIISDNTCDGFYCIYIKSKQQLLSITPECIWSLFDNENEWKRYKNLPLTISYLPGFHVASYDDIIFLFDKKSKEIWCFSIMFKRWFISQHVLPETIAKAIYKAWPIRDNSNCIHFISLYDQFHIKAPLKQLLPNEMVQCYKQLIMGYIRHIEQNQSLPTVPIALKLLILNYYI
eukprot:600125_1